MDRNAIPGTKAVVFNPTEEKGQSTPARMASNRR